MGRMLEVLGRGGGRRAEVEEQPESQGLVVTPESTDGTVSPLSGDDESVPFIEVGGPRSDPVVNAPKPAKTVVLDPQNSEPKSDGPAISYLSVRFLPLPKAIAGPSGLIAPELVTLHAPEHPISLHYRKLWREVSAAGSHATPRVLLFASPMVSAGVTTVVLNLAVAAARDSKGGICVLDANDVRPAAALRLGLSPAPGLREWLKSPYPLAAALQPTALPNLHVIAAGSGDGGDPATHPQQRAELIARLRQRTDCILIDAGLWEEENLGEWGREADAVYLVARRQAADAPEVNRVHLATVREQCPLRGYFLTAM
jgi:Mrp family chromosome partitioning ATPase